MWKLLGRQMCTILIGTMWYHVISISFSIRVWDLFENHVHQEKNSRRKVHWKKNEWHNAKYSQMIDMSCSHGIHQRDCTNWWHFNMASPTIADPLAECIFLICQQYHSRRFRYVSPTFIFCSRFMFPYRPKNIAMVTLLISTMKGQYRIFYHFIFGNTLVKCRLCLIVLWAINQVFHLNSRWRLQDTVPWPEACQTSHKDTKLV